MAGVRRKSKRIAERLFQSRVAFLEQCASERVVSGELRSVRRRRGKKNSPQIKTKGTYAWKEENSKTCRVERVPLDCPSDQVPFLPVGQSGLFVLAPRLKERGTTRFLVYKKRGKQKIRILAEFKKCCKGTDGGSKYCEQKGCANCAVKKIDAIPGWSLHIQEEYLYKHVDTRSLVDPDGVSNWGHVAPGSKSLTPLEAAPFMLTSQIYKYKSRDQLQIDPRLRRKWREEAKKSKS